MIQSTERGWWVALLDRIVRPVLEAQATGRLRASMPVEHHPDVTDRTDFTYLEAVGRTLAGIAPWLESVPLESSEGRLRGELASLAQRAIARGVDDASPDRLNFERGYQPIVDAAFLAHAILRAPRTLWHDLDADTQSRLVRCMRSTRDRMPGFNNWLLFAAMIETALDLMGEPHDPMRIGFAIHQHEQWYVGGGWYKDGPTFHHDYYNSIVIQPMLLDVGRHFDGRWDLCTRGLPEWRKRARRMAELLERMVAPDGSFAAVGRSITYRAGCFQLLAQLALQHDLPPTLTPAQVRCALAAVLHRTMDAPGTFGERGWLRIGLCGHQPALGEPYISTGSLYLCSNGLLPLGLPASDPFWSGPEQAWTSRRLWSGGNLPADHD